MNEKSDGLREKAKKADKIANEQHTQSTREAFQKVADGYRQEADDEDKREATESGIHDDRKQA